MPEYKDLTMKIDGNDVKISDLEWSVNQSIRHNRKAQANCCEDRYDPKWLIGLIDVIKILSK